MTADSTTNPSFLVAAKPIVHDSYRTTIQHWQLRDNIVFGKGSMPMLYRTCNNNVYFTKLEKSQYPMMEGGPFLDLGFSPSCIATGNDFVIVGGQRSQLSIRHLSSGWYGQTHVGGSINNSLCITNQVPGDPTSPPIVFVCNNDETIKIFSLPALEPIGEIHDSIGTPVNAVDISPDGKHLVAVGDANKALLYDLSGLCLGSTLSDAGCKRINTFKTTNDGAFSCHWNSSSSLFALSTQDGYICCFDIRMNRDDHKRVPDAPVSRPLHQFTPHTSATTWLSFEKPSTADYSSDSCMKIRGAQNQRDKSASRKVRFYENSRDLLVWSEHVNYMNMADIRRPHEMTMPLNEPEDLEFMANTSNSRQSFRICSTWEERAIAGWDIGPIGSPFEDKLFVALEDSLLEYTIDSHQRRVFSSYDYH